MKQVFDRNQERKVTDIFDGVRAGVISKNFNKGGSMHNHAHNLGVAQLQPCPYFHRWRDDNLA